MPDISGVTIKMVLGYTVEKSQFRFMLQMGICFTAGV